MAYCFLCNGRFEWKDEDYPPKCLVCGQKIGRGDWSKPDVLLVAREEAMDENGYGYGRERLGVIYINGDIHNKKKVKRKDRAQITKFQKAGVKVFVLLNDEIQPSRMVYNFFRKKKVKRTVVTHVPAWVYPAIALYYWQCMIDDELYGKYLQNSCIRYRVRQLELEETNPTN